jgi:hypothetical protein
MIGRFPLVLAKNQKDKICPIQSMGFTGVKISGGPSGVISPIIPTI